MLTATAEVRGFASRLQLRDPVATARALLTALAVDGHETPVLLLGDVMRLRPDGRNRLAQDLLGRGVQPADVIRFQRGALAQWQQLRAMQDLIRVGVADAGHEGLIAKQVLQLAWMPPDAMGEVGLADLEGVRAELRPAGDGGQGPGWHPVDAAHPDRVQEAQFVAAAEGEP